MAHYVTTVPSSKTPEEAFAYMSDIRNFALWDKGIKKVIQVDGDGAGVGSSMTSQQKGSAARTQFFATSHLSATPPPMFW